MNTSVDVLRVPKAHTSGKYLPINIGFIISCYGVQRNLV